MQKNLKVKWFLVLVAAFIGFIPRLHAQESATYRMERVTLAGGASATSSATYDNSVVIGQEGPSGVASFCGAGSVASLGFWSVLGDIPVPIQLGVGVNAANANFIDLSWTGAASSFQVFRDSLPDEILNPLNLISETTVCSEIDTGAGVSFINFYKVVATP